jgi:hypothetical protein
MRQREMKRVWMLGVMAVASIFALAACSSGISQEEAAAKDRQIADLQAQVSQLQGQVGGLQQDSKYWTQLTAFLPPVEMPSMSDHRAYMLPSGMVVALHFDNMDLSKAENLNWVAIGVPGAFCKADQERVEAEFGDGFTHFHDMMNDTHGGAPGAKGVWFVHKAVRDFESPMSGGRAEPGVDPDFRPTPPPECA